jgi:hypothetical protein
VIVNTRIRVRLPGAVDLLPNKRENILVLYQKQILESVYLELPKINSNNDIITLVHLVVMLDQV